MYRSNQKSVLVRHGPRRLSVYLNTRHRTPRQNGCVWAQRRFTSSSSSFFGSQCVGMYSRSRIIIFWDTILTSAASQNAFKKFSRKLVVFSNNNKNPDNFSYHAPGTDFFLGNMISPRDFKDRFIDTFGPVTKILEHCGNYFAVFLFFQLTIYVVVMVIRHLETTKMTGASLGFGKTLLSASYNIFLMSILTSMYDSPAPTFAAVEEKRKFYNMRKS